jgi:hypothetical protein
MTIDFTQMVEQGSTILHFLHLKYRINSLIGERSDQRIMQYFMDREYIYLVITIHLSLRRIIVINCINTIG